MEVSRLQGGITGSSMNRAKPVLSVSTVVTPSVGSAVPLSAAGSDVCWLDGMCPAPINKLGRASTLLASLWCRNMLHSTARTKQRNPISPPVPQARRNPRKPLKPPFGFPALGGAVLGLVIIYAWTKLIHDCPIVPRIHTTQTCCGCGEMTCWLLARFDGYWNDLRPVF